MQTERIKANNIKCQGCARTIQDGLSDLPEVNTVEVDIEEGEVTVVGEMLHRTALVQKLAELGYPEA